MDFSAVSVFALADINGAGPGTDWLQLYFGEGPVII